MNRKRFFPLAVFLLCSVSALRAETLLVRDGKIMPNAVIRVPDKGSPVEDEAARELSAELKVVSGATIPVVKGSIATETKTPEIVLATLADGEKLIPADIRKKLAADPSTQCFYIRTIGSRLLIAAKNPIGCYYGAMTLLEKTGIRYFHAGPEGSYYPSKKTISFTALDLFQTPSIERRMIGTWRGALTPWTVADFRQWSRRNKMHYGVSIREKGSPAALCGDEKHHYGGHLTFEQAVPKTLFATRPELFPLQKGKRVCNERSQRCLANPEVQKMVIDYGVACGKRGDLFGVNFHDSTDGWCECEPCRKYGTLNGVYSLSNLAHRFATEISAAILKQVPEAKGGRSLIYSDFRDRVSDPELRYDEGVKVLYCSHQRCYVHPLDDVKTYCNRKFHKELSDWRKHCPNLGIYDYYSYAQSPYTPMEYTLAHDLKLYRKMGLKSFYDDCTNKDLPIPRSNWPFYYVLAKMCWDTTLDVEKVLDDAYTFYYGKAAAPMKKYQALRRELWESAPGHASYGGGKRYAYCLTVEGAGKRLTDLLAEADKLAGDDATLKQRIAIDREYLAKFWIAEADKLKEISSGQQSIPVVRADGAIKIDANPDKAVWRQAPLVTGFRTGEGHQPAEDTRVKVAYDQDHFYFLIEAMTEHKWSPLKVNIKKHDDAVYSDDSVELFIMSPGSDYFHLVVNSIGTLYDARLRDITYQSGTEVKTRVLNDRYIVEMRVPVASMNQKITDGQVWRMNVLRNCRNLQPPKTREWSSLDGAPPHEPTRFRNAPIGQSVVRNGDFTQTAEVPASRKTNIGSPRFPANWSGVSAAMLTEDGRNQIQINNVIYSMLNVPAGDSPVVIRGEITASGKGVLALTVSSCVRKPGDKRGFGHENRRKVLEVKLTDKMTAYPFTFEFAPHENGYIYLNASDALVRSVSGAMSHK